MQERNTIEVKQNLSRETTKLKDITLEQNGLEMNAALIDFRSEAEQVFHLKECPKKGNGGKIGIFELT